MNKKKILFILHLPKPVHGAAVVGKFIKDSKIINKTFDADYINLSTSEQLHQVGKGGTKKLINLLKIQLKVFKALLTNKYDLCYMSLTAKGIGYYKDLMVVAVLKLFRKKIIYHFHNKGISQKQDKFVDNLLYRFTFKATKSILLSSLLYKDIANYVERKNTFFCANGIPEIPHNLTYKRVAKNLNTTCKLLFLSNMMVEKGVLVLLEACKLLKEKDILFECHFVGPWVDVSEEMFKNQVLEKALSDFVFSHGKKYDEDKFYFLNSADIFVFPTFYHNECFPLVLLEAMQFNLPIISTDEGGIADIIVDKETGFIVPKNDFIELAGIIELLIQNVELRLQIGEAAGERFKKMFTLTQFENRFSTILKESLN